ncbi:hypothetical protein ABZ746_24570 [Streptomyces sp. NPDC020096]
MKVRKSFASLAATAGAVAAVVLAPGTANASSGGGCAGTYEVRACISASGAYLKPDGYILSNVSACRTTYISLTDITTGAILQQESVGCWPGHYGPFPYKGINGHRYGVRVFMLGSSGLLASQWSYAETFSN